MSETAGRQEWFTAAEIASARVPGLSQRQIERLSVGWRQNLRRCRKASGRGGGWEYHISVLPPVAQSRLALLSDGGTSDEGSNDNGPSKALWARYEGLSKKHKEECARRLAVLTRVEALRAAGFNETSAIAMTAREKKAAPATIWRWLERVAGVSRADWLAALAPDYRPTADFADCDPRFWSALTSDFLRPEKPSFSACYRRALEAAKAEGWNPVPSERALRRRLKAEVDAGALVMAREGADKAKTLYPAQRRSRAGMEAMSAVNMDGHKFDVFVRFEDGRIGRPLLIAIQDVFSGKFLSWRHAESENKIAVRLCIGDMVTRHGIPEAIYLDNGRAFTSKWISGRTPTRFRFKVKDEDPQGLLVTLGVAVHWTTPYSGQSKPIERAFRDLCDDIAKHPFCSGAYSGNAPDAKPENYGSRAIPFDEFKAFADARIAEHNARAGRRTETAKGHSFDETFAKSMETAIVRWPTNAQRHLWLLAAESVTARKGSGEVHLFGNRYWAPALNAYAGKKVTVRFDPDALQEPLRIYDHKDALICEAPCIVDAGFASADDARTHSRNRRDYLKALRQAGDLENRMKVDDLADLYTSKTGEPVDTPAPPRVKRLAVGGARPAPAPQAAMDPDEFNSVFSCGIRVVGGIDTED